MGRKITSTFENYWGVRLTFADQMMLEHLLRRFAIGGDTKAEKLRLLIRSVYDSTRLG